VIQTEANDVICFSCTFDNAIKLPPLLVNIPFDYPNTSPNYHLQSYYDLFLPEGRAQFEYLMDKQETPFTVACLIDIWYRCICKRIIPST